MRSAGKAMKLQTFFRITLLATMLFIGAKVFAQDAKNDEQPQQTPQPVADNKITLLRHLGLTREQIQQILRINAERKPLMDAAQRRMSETTKQLDDTIYADNFDEREFQERLKNLQQDQAEVSRIRFSTEFAIRRVLTAEQLVKFRVLHDRFEAAQRNIQNQRRERILNRQNQTDLVRRPIQNNDQNVRRVIRPDQQQPQRPATRPQ
jgi:Spy/CpxP family protein refolding chaperone